MLRNEIQNKTGLTRKAIEYYEEKGFIKPLRNENNGYKNYSDDDLNILNQISLYRKLGLNINEIKQIINSNNKMLPSIIRKRQLLLKTNEKRQLLLEKLVQGKDLDSITKELDNLMHEETIYAQLERIFPGYFGQCFFATYKPFLNEPLTEENESAYNEYVAFLDELPELDLLDEEQEYLESNVSSVSMDDLNQIIEDKIVAINNIEKWLEENHDNIKQYEQYKISEDYLSGPLYSIQEKLNSYMIENKYYEIAIPLIRKFSKSYDLYYRKLMDANDLYMKLIDQ